MDYNCDKCEHALFDKIWGEYKCAILQHMIYRLEDTCLGKHYKKGEPKEAKGYEVC